MAPFDDHAYLAVQLNRARCVQPADYEVWHAGYAGNHPGNGQVYYWCTFISPLDETLQIPVPDRTTWTPPQLRIGWRPTEWINGESGRQAVLWQSERPSSPW